MWKSDTAFVLAHFLVSRAIYLTGGLLTAMLVASGPTEPLAALANPAGAAFHQLLMHGDGGWYQTIAVSGYEAIPFSATAQHNWAFFPLYPIVVRLLGGSLVAGIVVANLFTLAAVWLLLAETRATASPPVARWAVLFVLYWPFAGMLSSYRPESLLLLLAVATWALGRRGRWWAAWLAVALATMTRSEGIFVALLLLDPLWAQRATLRRNPWPVLVGAMFPLLGLAAFSWYLGTLTGDPLAWMHIEVAWGRVGFNPLDLLNAYWPPLFVKWEWDFAFLNWIVFGVVVAASVALISMRRYGFALFSFAWVVFPATFGASVIAMGRYATTVFPVAVLFAGHPWLRPHRATILAVMSALLFGVGAWTALGIKAVMP